MKKDFVAGFIAWFVIISTMGIAFWLDHSNYKYIQYLQEQTKRAIAEQTGEVEKDKKHE